MAYTESEVSLQAPATCQFCEDSTDIRWNCINCKLFLCQLCSYQIHSKSEASKMHQIVNIKDHGKEHVAALYRQDDLNHMTCSVHKGKKYISYCYECENAICFQCFREFHSHHQQQDMQDIYEDKISKIQELQGKIDSYLSFFQLESIKLAKLMADTRKEYDEVTEKIKTQETNLKDALTKCTHDFLQKCHSMHKQKVIKIQDAISKIQKSENDLKKTRNELDQVLLSWKASDVFVKRKISETDLPEKTESKIIVPNARFIPGEIQDFEFKRIFGELYEVNMLQLVNAIKLTCPLLLLWFLWMKMSKLSEAQ